MASLETTTREIKKQKTSLNKKPKNPLAKSMNELSPLNQFLGTQSDGGGSNYYYEQDSLMLKYCFDRP